MAIIVFLIFIFWAFIYHTWTKFHLHRFYEFNKTLLRIQCLLTDWNLTTRLCRRSRQIRQTDGFQKISLFCSKDLKTVITKNNSTTYLQPSLYFLYSTYFYKIIKHCRTTQHLHNPIIINFKLPLTVYDFISSPKYTDVQPFEITNIQFWLLWFKK